MAKHSRTSESTRTAVGVVAVAALAVAAAAVLVVPRLVDGDTGQDAGAGAGQEPATSAGQLLEAAQDQPAAAGDCTALGVVTAASFVPVLDSLAAPLAEGEDCVALDVAVLEGRGALAEVAASGAHVWIPDDTSWVAGADPSVVQPLSDPATVLATSPVYLVAGAEAAPRIGGPAATWAQVADVVDDTVPVRFVGHEPSRSGQGLVGSAAVGETIWAAQGMDAASGTLETTARLTRVVDDPAAADVASDEVALVAEHALLSAVAPAAGATVISPSDATAVLRYTWAPTTAGAGDPAVEAARQRLLATLTGPEAAAGREAAGLRDPAMAPLAAGAALPPTPGAPMEVLGAHHVEHVFAAWYREDRMADLTLVVDVSGSMWAVPPDGDQHLLAEVQDGVLAVAGQLPDEAQLGVWEFSTLLDPPRDHRVVHPLAPLSAGERGALDGRVRAMRPGEGGTGLHDTVLAAYVAARDAARPGVRSQVLVFTDGRNEADPGSITLEQLSAQLQAAADPSRPVGLAVVVYGPKELGAPLAEAIKPVRGYVSSVQTAQDVTNAFAHVAAGGLHS